MSKNDEEMIFTETSENDSMHDKKSNNKKAELLLDDINQLNEDFLEENGQDEYEHDEKFFSLYTIFIFMKVIVDSIKSNWLNFTFIIIPITPIGFYFDWNKGVLLALSLTCLISISNFIVFYQILFH